MAHLIAKSANTDPFLMGFCVLPFVGAINAIRRWDLGLALLKEMVAWSHQSCWSFRGQYSAHELIWEIKNVNIYHQVGSETSNDQI